MAKTALDEKDIHICGSCFLRSKILNLCLLSGDHKDEEDTCDRWLADMINFLIKDRCLQ